MFCAFSSIGVVVNTAHAKDENCANHMHFYNCLVILVQIDLKLKTKISEGTSMFPQLAYILMLFSGEDSCRLRLKITRFLPAWLLFSKLRTAVTG